jgi:hypothetical protein
VAQTCRLAPFLLVAAASGNGTPLLRARSPSASLRAGSRPAEERRGLGMTPEIRGGTVARACWGLAPFLFVEKG